MKAMITGHTRGLGLSIANKFIACGHTVTGYSLSNGFDIANLSDREKILSQAHEHDIFINNAYDQDGQIDLLKKFIKDWDGTNKIIVNISSKLSLCSPEFFPNFKNYILAKQAQNEIFANRVIVDTPRMLNILVGLVNTDMSSDFESKKIDPVDIANLIYNMIELKDKISVQQLTIDVPGLDWRTLTGS